MISAFFSDKISNTSWNIIKRQIEIKTLKVKFLKSKNNIIIKNIKKSMTNNFAIFLFFLQKK